MADAEKTVFISYRRSTSSYMARAIFMDLREHGYEVFLDVNTIDSGAFDKIILNQIAARAHFLVLLSPGALKRCADEGDWLRREIEEAIRLKRNIVPLIAEGFNFKKETGYLPEAWREQFRGFNGPRLFHDYFESGMEMLRSRFLKQPVYGEVIPTPVEEHKEVERLVEEVVSEGAPTEKELSAEEYFNRAYARDKNDYEGKILDYSEAIRLDPDDAYAYNDRGEIYFVKRQYQEALADFEVANRLNPDYKSAQAGLAITYHTLEQIEQAQTVWRSLISEDARFQDFEWVRKELHWADPLVEAARRLIATL